MHTHRFEPTAGGKLELLLTGRGGSAPGRTYGLVWRDTTWAQRWQFDSPYDLQHIAPCLNDSGVQMIVFATQPPGSGPGPFYMAFVVGDSVTGPDSIDAKYNSNTLTVGTEGPHFRWAAGVDRGSLGRGGQLKLYSQVRSPSVAPSWTRLRTPSELDDSVGLYMTLQSLGDSTCLVIVVDGSNESPGLSWGVVNDTGWVRPPEMVQWFGSGDRPLSKRLPSGDYLVMYGNTDSVSALRTLRGETWSGITALRWNFPTSQDVDYYFMYSGDMSLDHRPLPVLTAVSYNSSNGSQVAHVAVPDSGRYARGEWIPGSLGAGIPWVARDENGDVWLAWSKFYDGTFWLHSHVTSTCEAPVLESSGGAPRLRWTLSARTPESAWRVLRSADDGPYEPLGRVIAGDALGLSYVDTAAPDGARLRYRIRRESRDTRYIWESEPSVEWLPRTSTLGLRMSAANPVSDRIELQVTGAGSGELEMGLLDLQGRTVATMRQAASGTGRDTIEFPISGRAGLRPGLYLLRVRSDTGATSRALKLALIR